jgi:hypothetical protein
MGLAEYMIISKPDGWTVLHDGAAQHDYDTKEAAFEAASPPRRSRSAKVTRFMSVFPVTKPATRPPLARRIPKACRNAPACAWLRTCRRLGAAAVSSAERNLHCRCGFRVDVVSGIEWFTHLWGHRAAR